MLQLVEKTMTKQREATERQLINKENMGFWITVERNGKWKTMIDLGSFNTKEEAFLAYEELLKKLFAY